jgi:hypothetical protein
MRSTAPLVSRFDHLERLSDERGIFEHASFSTRRLSHGYCTDDNARLLIVTSRHADEGIPGRLSRLALRFVLSAQASDGRVHNRMSHLDGLRWTDSAATGDWWGRALWGLGVAAKEHPHEDVRAEAAWAFRLSAQQRSPFLHSMAFAALGAADMIAAHPQDAAANALLHDAAQVLGVPGTPEWPWPRVRLTYANASIPEAVIAVGAALGDGSMVQRGLRMLDWLVNVQMRDGHLSVVGVGGRGPRDSAPQFDQQPIEVAALSDACWRAWTVTGDDRWLIGVALAAQWFAGANDVGCTMFDVKTGGGYDGLTPSGPNPNQGAESTLAYVSAMQRWESVRHHPRALEAYDTVVGWSSLTASSSSA